MAVKQLKRGRCQVAEILERTWIQGNIVLALLEEMKHVRCIHVARQCGATDSVEEIRETRIAESGETVQMERMEHLVSRKARPRVQDKRPHVGRPLSGR